MPVLEDVNLMARAGEIVGIIGGNGSGKSTLLRSVAGLIKVIDGDILIDEHSILHKSVLERVRDLKLGFVLQHNRCVPDLTVAENLHLAQWSISSWSERERNIRELLSNPPFFRLREQINDYANVLSGGGELLLALAAVVLQGCELLLLDEPSDGLDESNRVMVVEMIRELRSPTRIIIVVEQLLRVLFAISDRVYLVTPGKGLQNAHLHEQSSRTLSELQGEIHGVIRGIYENSPALSREQSELIHSSLWQGRKCITDQ